MRTQLVKSIPLAAIVTSLSCGDLTGPTQVASPPPRTSLVDSRSGGAQGFYFLPPIAPATTYAGEFDADRSPSVDVCRLGAGGSCVSTIATFVRGTGTDAVRVDSIAQHYIVQWHTAKTAVAPGETYRVAVSDGSLALGHADVRIVQRASEAKSVPGGFIPLVVGATLPVKFRLEAISGGNVDRLEIHPRTFLLPGTGASLRLEVRAYDATGQPVIPGPISWTSSRPSVIAVSSTGIVTANVGSGSSQLTAQVGSVVSSAVLGLVAETASDALLISDDNVLPAPDAFFNSLSRQSPVINATSAAAVMVPLDPAAPYQPGWRYKTWLTGVEPQVGQIVISQGESPIGGRVVSVAPSGSNFEVTMELIPLNEMLPGLAIDERFELDVDYSDITPSVLAEFDVRAADGGMTFSPKRDFRFARGIGDARKPSAVLDSEIEFSAGPFDCKVVTSAAPVQPVVSNYTYQVNPDLSLDVVYGVLSGLQKFIVRGSVDASVAVTQQFPAQVEQKLECELHLATIFLPIAGPLSLFLGGNIPVGVGFEVAGKLAVGNIGVESSASTGAAIAIGIDYSAGPGPFASITPAASTGSFKLLYPDESSDLRNDFSASAFGYAKLQLGNPFIEDLQFEAFGAKVGPKQSFAIATPESQAGDPAYASGIKLSLDFEAGTGSELSAIGNLLGLNMSALKNEASTPLAQTPRIVSFQISPSQVGAESSSGEGEEVSFILSLDPVTYLGSYAVDSIELRRRKNVEGGGFVLEEVPGGCGRIAPTVNQSLFSCQTSLPESWAGVQTVYAFVKPKLFGVSLPMLFELSEDAKATVTVDIADIVVTPSSATVEAGETQQFSATVTGLSNNAVSWSATGGTINWSGTYVAGNTPGNYLVVAASAVNPTLSDTAEVVVTGSSEVSGITVTPAAVWLAPGQTRTFTAVVEGSDDQSVTWTATGGLITPSGVFTAGLDTGVYDVKATSIADPTRESTAAVTIAEGSVAALPNLRVALGAGSTVGWSMNVGPIGSDNKDAAPNDLDGVSLVATSSTTRSWEDDPALPGSQAGNGTASGTAALDLVFGKDPVTENLIMISDDENLTTQATISGYGFAEAGASSSTHQVRFAVTGSVAISITMQCSLTLSVAESELGGQRSAVALYRLVGSTATMLSSETLCEGAGQQSATFTERLFTGVYFIQTDTQIKSLAATEVGDFPGFPRNSASASGRAGYAIVFTP